MAWRISNKKDPAERIIEFPYQFLEFDAAREVEKNIRDAKSKGKKDAAVYAAIKKASESGGHLFVPEGRVEYFMDVDIDVGEVAQDHEDIVTIETRDGGEIYYTQDNYDAENIAASELGRLAGRHVSRFDLEKLDRFHEFDLTEQQRDAVENMLTSRVGILTGLPGTGKSVTCRALVWMCQQHGIEPLLMAPTGIAAKRLSQCCKHPASTCHRAIYSRMEDGYFEESFVLVDEASMLDQEILSWIATLSNAQIIFVGDPNQLPSVGEGEVLHDMIESEVFSHSHLDDIFRSEGVINENAKRVCHGDQPKSGPDFTIHEEIDLDRVVEEFVSLDGFTQVLSPGWDEVDDLNRKIKDRVNPPALKDNELVLAEGDRVLCTDNNYDLGVFNGDMGRIEQERGREYSLSLPSQDVDIPKSYAKNSLIHAWATTIHRSQGQEYDNVIVVWPDKGWCQYRELFYTAITRAKKMVIIFGDNFDVDDQRKGGRNTFFDKKLENRSY